MGRPLVRGSFLPDLSERIAEVESEVCELHMEGYDVERDEALDRLKQLHDYMACRERAAHRIVGGG